MILVRICCLSALTFAAGCSKQTPPPLNPEPPLVTVAKPLVEQVTEYSDLTGILDGSAIVKVRPRVSGYLLKVHFKEGQEITAADVEKGFVLFEIDPAPYQSALDKAKAELANWEAQRVAADAELQRVVELKKRDAGSQSDVDKWTAQVGVAVANIQGAKAAINRAQLDLDYTKVKAAIPGRIDRAYVTAGNVVSGGLSEGTILTTIVTTKPIYAYFDVDDQTVMYYRRQVATGKLKSSDETVVPVEVAMRGETGYPHKGIIDFAANMLNPQTGSLQIRGVFDNKDNALGPPGAFVRARVPISVPMSALLIPEEAIFLDQAKKIVYVINAENVVEAREVLLGPSSKGLRVVSEGLKPEDRVVIKGGIRIRPKMKVQPEEGKIEARQ